MNSQTARKSQGKQGYTSLQASEIIVHDAWKASSEDWCGTRLMEKSELRFGIIKEQPSDRENETGLNGDSQ